MGDADFGQAQGSQLVEAFLNGEVEMPPMPGQFLDNAISQHDYESMSAGAGFKSDVNGAQLQIDGFAGAKCPFDQGEVLIAGVDGFFGGNGLREIGFQDIAAIQLADRGQRVMVLLLVMVRSLSSSLLHSWMRNFSAWRLSFSRWPSGRARGWVARY